MRTYREDPNRYTFVTTLLSDIGIPYDLTVGDELVALDREGLVEIMRTSNIRIRISAKGVEWLVNNP